MARIGEENKKSYHIKNILVREDLAKVQVVLAPQEGVARDRILEHAEEEMMVNVQEIEISKERSISVSLARDGMKLVAETANTSPLHVQLPVDAAQAGTARHGETGQEPLDLLPHGN